MRRRNEPACIFDTACLTVLRGPGDGYSFQLFGAEPLAILTRTQTMVLVATLLTETTGAGDLHITDVGKR